MTSSMREYHRVDFAAFRTTQLVESALLDFVDQHPESSASSDRIVVWSDPVRPHVLYLSAGALAVAKRLFEVVPRATIVPSIDLPMSRVLVIGDARMDDHD